ncbi:MAG: hypothetical protein ACN4GG_12230 [Akkermansiaceae bacterium]
MKRLSPLVTSLFLISCALKPGTAPTGPDRAGDPVIPKAPRSSGIQVLNGFNKAVSGVNQAGGAIRNYQAIQSLF